MYRKNDLRLISMLALEIPSRVCTFVSDELPRREAEEKLGKCFFYCLAKKVLQEKHATRGCDNGDGSGLGDFAST